MPAKGARWAPRRFPEARGFCASLLRLDDELWHVKCHVRPGAYLRN